MTEKTVRVDANHEDVVIDNADGTTTVYHKELRVTSPIPTVYSVLIGVTTHYPDGTSKHEDKR